MTKNFIFVNNFLIFIPQFPNFLNNLWPSQVQGLSENNKESFQWLKTRSATNGKLERSGAENSKSITPSRFYLSNEEQNNKKMKSQNEMFYSFGTESTEHLQHILTLFYMCTHKWNSDACVLLISLNLFRRLPNICSFFCYIFRLDKKYSTKYTNRQRF